MINCNIVYIKSDQRSKAKRWSLSKWKNRHEVYLQSHYNYSWGMELK